jgi:hypothetical protein
MSDNEAISSSKLLYSRDFLIRYSTINKPDPDIAEKLIPVVDTPLGSSCTLPKRTKTMTDMITQNSTSKKNTSIPVYFPQKDNNLNLSHPLLSKTGLEPYTTPVKKGNLVVRTARPVNKPPITRNKTWVAAVESNQGSQEVLEQFPPDSILTPEPQALVTPLSSPHFKTPISRTLHQYSTPASSSAHSEMASFLSPKSQSATPYKTPGSPLARFTSSKSPRSPIRPISPLDEQRLAQRQKQIDYGYRTVGYLRYRLLVAKDHRKPDHPRTPKKTQGCSKRSWDGQLKKWRRDLHLWDPDNVDAFKALLNSDLVVSIIAANPELAEIVDIVKEKLDNPNADFDDDLGDDSDLSYSIPLNQSLPALPSENGFKGLFNEKKVSPRIGDESKVHTKVARTLVF